MGGRLKRLSGLIFDLDGTLVDSLQTIAATTNCVLVRHGLCTHSVERYRAVVGEGPQRLLERLVPERPELHKQLLQSLANEYRSNEHRLPQPFPGVVAMLEAVVSRVRAMGVLSNKPHGVTQRVVECCLPSGLFCDVRGAGAETPPKPSPVGARLVAERMGVAVDECAMVGDTALDLETARAAGMVAIGVEWGMRPAEVAEAADYYLREPIELIPLIDRVR